MSKKNVIKGTIDYSIEFKKDGSLLIEYDSTPESNFVSMKITNDLLKKLIENNSKLHKRHPNRIPKEDKSVFIRMNYLLDKILNSYALNLLNKYSN